MSHEGHDGLTYPNHQCHNGLVMGGDDPAIQVGDLDDSRGYLTDDVCVE